MVLINAQGGDMRDVHGSGYQQALEGKRARQFWPIGAADFGVLPLHGPPTPCVFVPRCAPVMGAGPRLTEPGPEPDSAKMLFLAPFFHL